MMSTGWGAGGVATPLRSVRGLAGPMRALRSTSGPALGVTAGASTTREAWGTRAALLSGLYLYPRNSARARRSSAAVIPATLAAFDFCAAGMATARAMVTPPAAWAAITGLPHFMQN